MDQLMENLSNKNLEVMTRGSLLIDHWKRFLSPELILTLRLRNANIHGKGMGVRL